MDIDEVMDSEVRKPEVLMPIKKGEIQSDSDCQGVSPNPTSIVPSPKYVLTDDPECIFDCALPAGTKNIPSEVRQRAIIKKLNFFMHAQFLLAGKDYRKDGYSVAGIDEKEKWILITADDKYYLLNPRVQEMVRHFDSKSYCCVLWLSDTQQAHLLIKESKLKAFTDRGQQN